MSAPLPAPKDGFYPHQQGKASQVDPKFPRFIVSMPGRTEVKFFDVRGALDHIRALPASIDRQDVILMDRRRGIFLDPETGKRAERQVT